MHCWRRFAPFALALLIAAGAQAATVNSTLTLTGTATASTTGTSYAVAGTATLTGLGSGGGTLSGAFASTISLTNITGSTLTAPFTITISSGNTLTGNWALSTSALGGPGGIGSLTITGGTGSYAGYTGTFSSLAETGSISATGITVNCSGTGTVNTAGGGTTTAAPTIAAVLDGASFTANIAPGSFFSVFGTSLGPSSPPTISFPRPTTVGGVKVTFTPVAGGAGTDTYLVYVGAGQINCILPSTVSPGNYNVTVTNGTVSAPFVAQVVASKVALFTQDQSGTGLPVVQNYISATAAYDVNRLTTGVFNGSSSSPAKPGQVLVAWGTGIGAYTAGDNGTVTHDFSASEPITAIVGGVSIQVAFAGLNGYAAEDQINFTLPGNVPTGCAVSLQISVNGVLSATTYISIAPNTSATACVQPGYTTAQLQNLDNGGTINTGSFSLTQIAETVPQYGNVKFDSIGGSFNQLTAFQLAGSTLNYSVTTSGSCMVVRLTCSSTVAGVHVTNLDAGTVTITGPSGTNLNSQKIPEDSSYNYSYTIGTEGISIPGQGNGSILPGTYNLTGAGGNDVGTFNTSITIGSPLTLSPGLPTTVTESAGLTLNWTGGNASDVVQIIGLSGTACGTGANAVTNEAEFVCTTTAGQKTFTVPASILTQLPTVSAAQESTGAASGFLEVFSGVTPVNFTPTLKKDGSSIPSTFSSFIGTGATVVYQ